MKKRLASLLCAALFAMTSIPALAAEKKEYMVPVKLVKTHEKEKESMANAGLKPEAKVVVEEKSSSFTLYLKPIEIQGAKENINKLFIMDGDKKVEATKTATNMLPYDVQVDFKLMETKPNEIKVAFWVNAMDKLKGGKEGAGEETAILVLDWAKATEAKMEMTDKDKKEEPKKEEPKKEEPKKEEPMMTEKPMAKNGEILVYVGSEAVKFDSMPVSKKGRVLVPLRAIFEAMKAEVKWDAATQTVTATKDGKTITLTMNKAEAKVNDGTETKTIQLDVPASMEKNRTYVPLRFIGQAFGNKVDFEKQADGSLIHIH